MARILKLVGVVSIVAALGGAGFAVTAGAQETGSDEPVTFTIGMVNDAITFNPMFMIETPEYETAGAVYDMLLGFDAADMSTIPALATEWEQSGDGLTWTFTIRDDAVWHDGEPVTAHDIAFTYNWILDEGVGSFLDYLPYTDEITAPDDTTLVWRTTQPTGAPLYPPFIYIMPEHIWNQYEDKADARTWKGFPDTVGSGPFELVEWRRGDFWRLEANPDYWDGAPKIDELVYRVFQNEETMVQALQQGEIDYAFDVPPALFESLQGNPDITTNEGGSGYFIQMSTNQCTEAVVYCADTGFNGHPALLDPQVRLAMEYAIDRQTLVDRVKLGYAEPAATVIINPRWHLDPPNQVPFDLAEANRILDEAGYADTDGDGVREMPDGSRPLEFRFIVRTENPDTIRAGEFISEWFADIGIATLTEPLSDARLTDVWYSNDWDLYIWGWGVEPDPNFQLSTYTEAQCGTWSDTCWANAEYDRIFAEQQRATSVEERTDLVEQLQQMLYDARPEIVLWYDNTLEAYSNDWTGFIKQPQPEGFVLFQYGTYSYRNIEPVTAVGGGGVTDDDEGGGGVPIFVWIGAAAVVVLIGAVTITRRRREERDEI
jgi:peptide/nickel transport system substrate-binding protein